MSTNLFNLNRIRIDIGSQSGNLTSILKYANFKGYDDNGTEQDKPRITGTFTITSWYTAEMLAKAKASIDGLTIIENPDWLFTLDDCAMQTLDNTKEGYQPYVAVVLHNAGYGYTFDSPIVEGQEGRWMITKKEMEQGLTDAFFHFRWREVFDVDNIVTSTSAFYRLTVFNEFKYFGTSYRTANLNSSRPLLANNPYLEEVTVPTGYDFNSLTANLLGSGLFNGCASLKTVHNFETVDLSVLEHSTYGQGSSISPFMNCSKLENVSLPPTATKLSQTFQGCSKLDVSSCFTSNVKILFGTFNGAGASRTDVSVEWDCSNLEDMGASSFANCPAIKKLYNIPCNLDSAWIFQNCSNLVYVSVTDAVTSITGTNMCWMCGNLKEFHIGIGIKSLGSSIFANCKMLNVVHIAAPNPPTGMPSIPGKYYLGDGSSAEHDDAILATYLADATWGANPDKLDTWYNYLHPTE